MQSWYVRYLKTDKRFIPIRTANDLEQDESCSRYLDGTNTNINILGSINSDVFLKNMESIRPI